MFYTTADGEYKVANIRTLDDIDLSSGGKQTAYVTNDGKVVAAFVALAGKPSGASDDTLYGIITDDGQVTSKNGDPYTMFTVWTGEETTVYVEGDTVSSLNKGALVSFDKSADDTYDQSDFTILDGTNTAKGQAIAVSRLQRSRPDHYLCKCTEAGRRRLRGRRQDHQGHRRGRKDCLH